MNAFKELLRTQFLVFARDKMALFFTFLFPLVFILIFGFIWGGLEGNRATKLGLAVLPGAEVQVLDQVLSSRGPLDVHRYSDRAALEVDLGKRRVDFGLVWDGKMLLFLYDPTRVQENYAFQEVARGISADFDLRRQGLSSVVGVEKVHVGRAKASWFNMIVPGIMAFSILTSGLFAVSGRITYMKERKLLNRLIVTPMSPGAFLAAIAGVRLAVGYVSTLITLALAVALFNAAFQVNWPLYTAFVVAATLGTMGLGTLIALVVRRPGSASTVANIAAQIMMFLSGMYIPVELMPSFLRAVSRALPLTYMVEGMRYVTGVGDMSPTKFLGTAVGLGVLGVLLLPVLGRYVVSADRR
ncbi:MAG: ABC transporter permease [Candidatus Acetothermia bacterium]|jgi:ABC-2 type transport system permease protein|nr:ABC transporter permease [Candidatus Acetothermia bacterium]